MSYPLSIAAGVAGLVALAGTTSKCFYQFFRSIYNAPATARDLASALYTLKIALGQIQENLLNPRFVAVAEDDQIASLEACMTSCVTIFSDIQAKVNKSGLADAQQNPVKKTWESVRASYNEDDLRESLRRVEAEKTTLLLVVDIFSA